jgi:glycosyltransferase involved in cell wall biosynthesis
MEGCLPTWVVPREGCRLDCKQSLHVPAAGVDAIVACPSLSIVVPVYNSPEQLSKCLEALGRSDFSNYEVIVVDDCSTEDIPEAIVRHGARAVRTSRTLGPAAARNLGVEYARAGIVVFVDADVVLPETALGMIAEVFENDPGLAAVFGSYDEDPAWKDFLSQYKNLMHGYLHQDSKECAVTFWAGCGAVRKSVFLQYGGFDANRYREPSIEDIELGYRLVRGGERIRLDKRIRVKHLKRWTLLRLLKADIFCRAIPWTTLIFETRCLPKDLNLSSSARASSAIVGLLSLTIAMLLLQIVNLLPIFTAPGARVAEIAIIFTLMSALVTVNWRVYSYFGKARGWWFAARTVPVHWLYYLYSGVIFAVLGTYHMVRFVGPIPASAPSRAASYRSRS